MTDVNTTNVNTTNVNTTEGIVDAISQLALIRADKLEMTCETIDSLPDGYNTMHYFIGMTPEESAKLIIDSPSDAGNKGLFAVVNIQASGDDKLHIFHIKTYKTPIGVQLANEIVLIAGYMNCLQLAYFSHSMY